MLRGNLNLVANCVRSAWYNSHLCVIRRVKHGHHTNSTTINHWAVDSRYRVYTHGLPAYGWGQTMYNEANGRVIARRLFGSGNIRRRKPTDVRFNKLPQPMRTYDVMRKLFIERLLRINSLLLLCT